MTDWDEIIWVRPGAVGPIVMIAYPLDPAAYSEAGLAKVKREEFAEAMEIVEARYPDYERVDCIFGPIYGGRVRN